MPITRFGLKCVILSEISNFKADTYFQELTRNHLPKLHHCRARRMKIFDGT